MLSHVAGVFRLVLLVPALLAAPHWCAPALGDPGTRKDRSALFDYILKATMERTAFSRLSVEKKASITALSSQSPRRLIEQVMPCASSTRWSSSLA